MSPCDSCHAGCCRTFAVPLTGADILRIERGLQLPFREFVSRWPDREGRIARNYAPHFRFEDDPETPYVIALAHRDSRFFPETTCCIFLHEQPPDTEHPLGRASCGIYEHRPAACRAFPTRFNETGELVVLHDVPQISRDADQPVYALCPREWMVEEIDPLQSFQDLAAAKAEMSFFQNVAQIWNRKPRSWHIFPEFLRLVYENRVVRKPGQDADVLKFQQPASTEQPRRRAA